MTDNRNNVPKKQWKKWGNLSRKVFNETFDIISANQELYLHPNAAIQRDSIWNTTAWNVAWTAADAVEQSLKEYIENGNW